MPGRGLPTAGRRITIIGPSGHGVVSLQSVMRVAFVLLIALVCVAVVAAGSGKDKKKREGKEERRADSWEGKKEHKEGRRGGKEERGRKDDKRQNENKENRPKDKKRTKREETQRQPQQEQEAKPADGKDGKQYQKQKTEKSKKNEKRAAEQETVKQEEPTKKKSKKTEAPVKEEAKKTKGKKTEKVEKIVEEPVEEEVSVETEETVESANVEGECPEEPSEECGEEPTVTLASGSKVKGKKGKSQSGRDTAEFTGVPYAEPPVGEERLKEPVLKDSWLGVLDATTPANECLQWSHFSYSVVGSEDCLYLNIYTPKVPKGDIKDTDLMPVVFYIHGGCFMFFSSVIGGPGYLLDQDMVIVTINYRLGPLGFLSLQDDSVVGNLGLRDQMTALKWVQANIRSFGGDPKRVAIAGMSAGSASVHYHILSPLSRGLFSKAISLSGSALNPWTEAEDVVNKSLNLIRKLGCDGGTTHKMIACLRTRPGEKIVAVSKEMQAWLYNPISPWAPSPEPKTAVNPFLPDTPINMMLDGTTSDVPWLVSWTDKEGGYPGAEHVFDDANLEYLEKHWNEVVPHILEFNYTAPIGEHQRISESIRQFYLKGLPVSHPDSKAAIIDMQSDRLFLEGIAEMARIHASKNKSPIFTYRFSHVGTDSVSRLVCHCDKPLGGACHADDVGYFLEALAPKLTTQEDLQLSKDMVSLWYSFVTTGVPVFRGVTLPTISRGMEPVVPFLDIGQGGKPTILSDPDLGNQAFWSTLGLSDLSRRSTKFSRKDEL